MTIARHPLQILAVVLLAASCFVTTWSAEGAQEKAGKPVISVGSKNFGESYLLAEIVSRLIEDSGFEVDRRFGLGGTLVCYEALLAGEIDVYVEYTGTIEKVILKDDKTHPTLTELNGRIDDSLLLLDSVGFNNTYAMAVKGALADQLKLSVISDLRAHPELKVAFSLEFLNREDGWPGLMEKYQLSQIPIGIDHGLAYQAIGDGEIEMTDAYSTDGDLERYQLRVLEDDLGYFPDYFAVPFLRKDLPDEVKAQLAKIQNSISGAEMRSMNAEVVIANRSFAEVAEGFLSRKGLSRSQDVQVNDWDSLLKNVLVHLKLTAIALSLGCLIGLPLGIAVFKNQVLARSVVYVAGLLQTIPSIALLALMIPVFGIGEVPAIIALFLYSILPILRNTITALITIDPVLKRVAEGIGLTNRQQLIHVLVPLALPNILAGIKTAAIISIGTATLAAFIGAGGLGVPIVTGLALNDTRLIMQGAIPAAILAIMAELLFELLERMIVKPHMLEGRLQN